MLSKSKLPLDLAVNLMKAAGEPTRLRLLALLEHGDLTVSDLIDILGQSQPRISRHLKLLSEAGLLERYREGAWAYFRLAEDGPAAAFVQAMLDQVNDSDPQILRDLERLEDVRARRSAEAAEYFAANAAKWDEIRKLHVDDSKVETAIREILGPDAVGSLLDIGTGTGRMLILLADLYQKAIGVDASREMLSIARSNLNDAGLSRVQVRQGDLLDMPTGDALFDAVTLHQVLHYLDDPARAIRQTAKSVAPGGRLLIVDFAPHELEFLREKHAHLRLGFATEQVSEWLEEAGLELVKTRKLSTVGQSAGGSLVVTLWLAQLAAGDGSLTRQNLSLKIEGALK